MPSLKVSRPGLIFWVSLLLGLGLAACQAVKAAQPPASPAVNPTAAAPTRTPPAAPTRTPGPTPAPDVLVVPDYLPQALKDGLTLPPGWTAAPTGPEGTPRLDMPEGAGSTAGLIQWVYALAAPFPTVADTLTAAELQTAWQSGPTAAMPFQSLLVDPSTRAIFEKRWGPASAAVKTTPAAQLVDAAWAAKTAWAIVPFEQLEPRWKVIGLDGQSPVQKTFDPAAYPLTLRFTLMARPNVLKALTANGPLAPGNRQPDRLTQVTVTGVTALVRGTASFMEGRGLDYPAMYIGDWLREADILHVSNEVSFAQNCPPPFDWQDLKFCSRPKYLQLLKDVGVKVVELTGDHLDDWGPEAFLYTLQLYKDAGIKYYAGGANITEAQQPALFEHNGNKIAFLGCNAKDPGYAKASDTYPGAVHCDMDQMAAEVRRLRADGYLPIVTFQHLEYYSYPANPILQKDFRQMAGAGAVIVSGSQAHQPHAMEFKDGAFLHYGLGNLFFDQTNQGEPPRTAFIDRHIFYNGRYISTELLTIYLIDYARSRPMTLPERQDLLKAVFAAGGW